MKRIETIATLARLSFSPEEMSGLKKEMDRMKEYLQKLHGKS